MSGLFSIFNVAVRGMNTQQSAINVTSHNIANANTAGYSRQRAIIETTTPFGSVSINNAVGPGQFGTGSQVSSIQRVRDNFLDYQVRNETSTLGEYGSRNQFLSEIEGILNEPSTTGLSSLMGKFFDGWQTLSTSAESSNSRTVVANQSAALANELNHTYGQLQKVKENINSTIKNTVFDVNSLLDQIDDLNQQIITVKVGKQEPNDLMDKRDNLLDELSSKFGITVDNKSFYGQDISPLVQTDSSVTVNNAFSNAPTNSALVKSQNNTDVRRLSYINSMEDTGGGIYKIVYYKNGDMSSEANKVEINVDLSTATAEEIKTIKENRVLWADNEGIAINGDGTKHLDNSAITYGLNDLKLFNTISGELKGLSSVQNDTDKYINELNRLAKSLAFSVNAIHSGVTDSSVTPNNDGTPFFINKDYDGETVTTILAHEDDINAGNISVNSEILKDVMKIKTRTNDDKFLNAKDNNMDGESDGKRALLVAGLRNSLISIQNINTSVNSRADMFNPILGGNALSGLNFSNNTEGMTMDSYFKDIVDRLGIQAQEAQRMIDNQGNLLDAFTQSRESVSGVSLDEEMANLVQYQHCYQANAKVISTVDELLDVVINGLKR